MDKELEQLITDYVNLKVKNPEERKVAVMNITDYYESMQAFEEQENGGFKMVTGDTFEQVADFLKNDLSVKDIIDKANKSKGLDRE